MRSMIVASMILGLLGAMVSADTCLGRPGNVKIGKFCGGPTSCEYGSFCNTLGVCQALRKGGESCVSDSQCEFGHNCQGPENSQVCVAYASAGESCDTDLETTNPSCSQGSCVEGICLYGYVGDKCVNTASCFGNTTCATVCQPLADGDSCTSTLECKPTSYCDQVEEICRPKKTEGICQSEDQCAYGYGCIGISDGDDAEQCVEFGSRGVGEFCNEDNRMCSSGNCHDSDYCAKRGVNYCERDSDCSYGEVCACNGQPLEEGYGTCQSNGCLGAYERYEKCAHEKCGSVRAPTFTGDCRYLNCEKEAMKYFECSPASQVVFSFVFVALFALLSTFFGKNL